MQEWAKIWGMLRWSECSLHVKGHEFLAARELTVRSSVLFPQNSCAEVLIFRTSECDYI